MEKENDHKMCDWCGNEYGRKYRWWRLVLAILIGLFIFLAGIEIGQTRASVYGPRGDRMTMGAHMYRGGMYGNEGGMNGGAARTTTIVVPANPTGPSTTVNPGGPMIPATTSTTTTQ